MHKIQAYIFLFLISTNSLYAGLMNNTWSTQQIIQTESNNGFFWSSLDFLTNIWYWFLIILVVFLCFYLCLLITRFVFEIYYAKNLRYLKITLPKMDSKLDKEKETKKDFKEKIWMMNMFYKAIHKISEAWLKDTFLNFIFKHSKISLELVYENNKVSFYIVTYKSYVNLVSQHLTSIYNNAEILQVDKKDYINIKPKWYTMRWASLGKENDDVYPIRTYKYLEDDPLNNFVDIFGWLNKEDKAVYQIVIKPNFSFNKKAKNAAWLVAKWQYQKRKKVVFSLLWWLYNPIVWFIKWPDNIIWDWNNAPWASQWDAYKIFNQAETESQKIMWESAWQPFFESSIRVLVSSKDDIKSEQWVHAVVAASSIFTDEYNNNLDNPQISEDAFPFIFTPLRYFGFKYKLVWFFQNISYFSIDEISTLFHLPDITYNKSPIIDWLWYKKLSPPSNLKTLKTPTIIEEKDSNNKIKKVHRKLWGFPTFKDWVLLWWNEYRNKKTPVYFHRNDRARHHYIIWKSWGWKSVFIWYLARQDIRNWDGVCVIDPHGDLVEDVLNFAPKNRAKDIIIFDPSDTDRPLWLNLLEVTETDPDARKREMDRASINATEIFIKIFGDEIFWPRIQHYFRNWCLTLMEDLEDGWTLIDVPRLFVDDAFRQYKVSKVKNPVVKSFWEHEYANTWDREKQEMIPYFSSKFGPFITNTTIRNIIGQPKSAVNMRDIMDNKKVLLVNLSKGKIWALNAQLLWLIFVSKINMAAMSRADIPENERKDFYLYVDEFQNFATETFWEILSEARKYHLALIMAHQYIAQIWSSWSKWKDKPSIKDAVFGNAWTIMSFKVWAEDAEYMEKEYAPLLSQQDIIWIANYTAYCKLNIDNASTRPFDLKTIWDNSYKNEKIANIIREYSRKKYWRKKKYIDMEIEARLWINNEK